MHLRSKTAQVLLTLAVGLAVPTAALASTGGASAPTGGSGAKGTSSATVRPSGVATWFGPGFYGNKTACGQTLTPAVVGVAHRTLPCGTLVKVSYGGHTLVVPVVDRGPYSHIGADWDLTAGAATAPGISDTVRIGTRVVGSAPNVPA